MGQFDSIGLKPVSRIGLSESDRGRGLPERDREDRPGTTTVTKKKDKPKTASAGGGANPPKPPKKGPTGGDNKNPKKDYKMNKDNDKSMGGLTKSRAVKKEDLMNPRDAFKRKK